MARQGHCQGRLPWLVASVILVYVALLQGATAATDDGLVRVNITVKGQVVVFTSHASAQRAKDASLQKLLSADGSGSSSASSSSSSSGARPPPRRRSPPVRRPPPRAQSSEGSVLLGGSSKIIRLEENVNQSVTAYVRVDLGEQAKYLTTGNIIEAPLTFQLDRETAEELGYGPGDGTRRRLTEAQHAMRRTLQAVNNTRRSLRELLELGVLSKLKGKGVATAAADVLDSVAPKDLMFTGKPLNVTSLTFLMALPNCKLASNLTTDALRAAWVPPSGEYGTPSNTLQFQHEMCSYGKLRVYDDDDNMVIGPIDAGNCTGVNGYGDAFDFTKGCSDPELEAMYDAVIRHMEANYPEMMTPDSEGRTKFANYRRKIMLMRMPGCGSVFGYGSVGCPGDGSPCRTWIFPQPGETKVDSSTIFHEMGHNQGVVHSAVEFKYGRQILVDEYADPVDPMGSAGPLTCYSAPNAFKAGWSKPIVTMTPESDPAKGFRMVDLPDGWNEYTIPAAALTEENFLRVIVDQTGISDEGKMLQQERAMLISYRVAQPAPGYDSGIATRDKGVWDRRIWVHDFNDTATGETATVDFSFIRAMMDAPGATSPKVTTSWPQGSWFTYWSSNVGETNGHLRVQVYSKSDIEARVGLCRFTVTKEEGEDMCSDDIDNDCDGYTDAKDPNCSPPSPPPAKKKASPPPPKRRPPPPTKKSG